MEKKRFREIVMIAVVLISVLNIVSSIILFNNFNGDRRSINIFASNDATVSLSVEAGDTTAPNLTIVSPGNTSYTSHRTELTYIASDTNLDACWYSLDSGVTNTTITCGQNATGITSSSGSNTWKVYANDTSGNLNSSSVTFTVTIPEAAAPAATGGAGGGGGGGAAFTPVRAFGVSPEEMNLFLGPGERDERKVVIFNNGETSLDISVSVSGLEEIISSNLGQIDLNRGEEKEILLSITAPEEGIHAGRVIFTSDRLRREIFVLVNVESDRSLFDVSIILPEKSKTTGIGEDVRAFISLVPIGPEVGLDVTANYIIKDFDGNILFKESETFYISEAKSYVKDFSASELGPGDYIVGVEIVYPGGFATSSVRFFKVERVVNFWMIAMILLAVLAFIVIVLSILRYKKSKKHLARGQNK